MRNIRVAIFVSLVAGAVRAEEHAGVPIKEDGLAGPRAELEKRVADARARVMKASGLAAATGGAHVRVFATDPQEVLLPIPQCLGGQVPLAYFVRTEPADAATESRLRTREGGDAVAVVRLAGKKQDVHITWSAVILLGPHDVTPDRNPAGPYKAATATVQSGADPVTKLAAAIWPGSGKAADFAANIQRHVRDMKRADRPRSLDAVGTLTSGENSICTGNANLAAALMRAKGIPCRTLAVIPPIGQRLEMHRVVEYADGDRWARFDPSSLQADIPARPWQNVVMARTTVKDEDAAMKPRMGAMPGCPYGQEAELLTPGVTLFGEDFFWTLAKPLAEFEPSEESARRAAEAWTRYLKTGTLTAGQLKAASAGTAIELADAWKAK
ncbi:MAG: transglutaminase domain-containing protein [Zavarzinella sp.]|nr:transglutaminase domain-containing protein [Zavarzinella sp.]